MKARRFAIIDKLIFLCLFIAFFAASVERHIGNRFGEVISSDAKGYYMYLPSVFIYNGIHNVTDTNFVGLITNKKGEAYPKFTCGVAYCYLPFFLCAHAYARVFHYQASGFSPPYQYGILMAGVCWTFLGLFLLKKLLLRYFSRVAAWLSILCIALGTNLYSYGTLGVGMSHVYSFALFAAAILLMDSYYALPSKRNAILLALVLGWIVLIRPTGASIFVFLFLYRVVSFTDLKERVKFFRTHLADLLLALPFFIGIIFPQLLYWKEMSGHWVKYSYQDERFIYWSSPKIAAVLFDVQNGWLLYSPVLLFLFWALLAKRRDPRTNFLATTLLLLVITYLFASWWMWNFGGAFGHRCYVDYYALLALPLAVTMEHIISAKKYVKIPLLIVITIFCYYSVAMATLYMARGIWDGPEWRWNYDRWWGLVRNTFND